MKPSWRINKSSLRTILGILVLALVAILATAPYSFAQDVKLSSEKREQIEQVITKFMAANQVPGISAAVVEDGKYAWSGGFGMADLEGFVPVTAQTLFRLASISKPMTAVATMQLWEHGKLDLDAPVQKYCPAFPEKGAPITTRLLLAHLSGIRHYRSNADDDLEVNNVKHFADPIQGGLQFFAKDPLLAKPGTKFNYTTHGYTVVGCAIEGASGTKYTDYMRQNIFLPAGMTHTQVDDRYSIIPYRARFYHKDDAGAVVNAEFLDSSYKIPGGGWLSSADDMARFEIAVLNDGLIKHATRDQMWIPQKASDGSQSGYALGWGSGNRAGLPDVGHSGSQQGTSTFILLVPSQQAGVVILVNMDGVNAAALGTDVMKIVLGKSADEKTQDEKK